MAILNSPFNQQTFNSASAGDALACDGCQTVSVFIPVGYTGTFVLEGSINGTDYANSPIQLYKDGVGFQTLTLPAGASGLFYGICSMYRFVRLRAVTYAAGSGVVTMMVSVAPSPLFPRSSDLAVTNTGISGAAVTLTLPAPVGGLSQFITRMTIERIATVALLGAATPVVVTTTNFNGMAYSVESDPATIGSAKNIIFEPCVPIRAQLANTAVTIVAPSFAGVIWRMTANYYNAL